MAEEIKYLRVKGGTAASASAANEILQQGEITGERDTGVIKVGDGSTSYNNLASSGWRTIGVADLNAKITGGDPIWLTITLSGLNAKVTDATLGGLDTANSYSKRQSYSVQTLTDASTIAWDLETEQVAQVTLGASRTLGLPTNIVDGCPYMLKVIQGGAGSYTITYNAAFKFGDEGTPTLSTAAGDVDYLFFIGHGTTEMHFTGIKTGY